MPTSCTTCIVPETITPTWRAKLASVVWRRAAQATRSPPAGAAHHAHPWVAATHADLVHIAVDAADRTRHQ
jgi:hypothetical protein